MSVSLKLCSMISDFGETLGLTGRSAKLKIGRKIGIIQCHEWFHGASNRTTLKCRVIGIRQTGGPNADAFD